MDKIDNIGLTRMLTQSYDFDGFTTQEVWSRIAQRMNIIIEHFNYLENTVKDKQELIDKKLDYLINEGLTIEIAKAVKEKIEDGTIKDIVDEQIFTELNEQLDAIENDLYDKSNVKYTIVDIGGKYNSYCSDMTRTVFIGKEPSKEHADIYNIVKSANEKAISIIKEGVKFSDIDNAARNIIKDAGYGEYFTHRTGHSIGIEVHDFGDVSAVNHEEVKAGMIFSVEPGIYLKDNIGVRIEDLVLVTKDGCEVLNSVTKEIVVL